MRIAAEAFSADGYHAVRLEDIADRVGVSTPALYRHFPNKYALFAETARHLADELVAASDSVPTGASGAAAELAGVLDALAVAAIENRRTGGLYRWELRYLGSPERDHVRSVVRSQHRRIASLLREVRADLGERDVHLVAAALVSVVASPTTHRTALPARDIRVLLRRAVSAVLTVDIDPTGDDAVTPAPGLPPTSKRELILAEAIRSFAARGFGDATVEQIAHAAGLPTSGVYRHFESKTAILEAAFWRASDRVTASITDALATAATPRQATLGLVERYIGLALGNTELISVYLSEIGHLTPRQRAALRNQQRVNVEEWAAWLRRDRPDLTAAQSRFLVQAALNVITDLSRLARPAPTAALAGIACRILHDTSSG
ncbi:TetR/AcrR family transcriptional regulator [Gordonia sinesedis]